MTQKQQIVQIIICKMCYIIAVVESRRDFQNVAVSGENYGNTFFRGGRMSIFFTFNCSKN